MFIGPGPGLERYTMLLEKSQWINRLYFWVFVESFLSIITSIKIIYICTSGIPLSPSVKLTRQMMMMMLMMMTCADIWPTPMNLPKFSREVLPLLVLLHFARGFVFKDWQSLRLSMPQETRREREAAKLRRKQRERDCEITREWSDQGIGKKSDRESFKKLKNKSIPRRTKVNIKIKMCR